MSLSGLTAMVCGSTQGIGLATAEWLASQGASILLVARNAEKLKTICQELPTPKAQKHQFLALDFSDLQGFESLLKAAMCQFPVVHILVNNTGGPPPGQTQHASLVEFQQAFSNHVLCNQLLVQALVPGMREAGYGRIINVISTSVKQPIAGLGVSNTIRAAVANWAKTLAGELGPDGITVNNVLPGYTETERLRALVESKAHKANKTVVETTAMMLAEVPLGRFAQAAEIAQAIGFLASPAAAYITGINLPVDGGRTLSL